MVKSKNKTRRQDYQMSLTNIAFYVFKEKRQVPIKPLEVVVLQHNTASTSLKTRIMITSVSCHELEELRRQKSRSRSFRVMSLGGLWFERTCFTGDVQSTFFATLCGLYLRCNYFVIIAFVSKICFSVYGSPPKALEYYLRSNKQTC